MPNGFGYVVLAKLFDQEVLTRWFWLGVVLSVFFCDVVLSRRCWPSVFCQLVLARSQLRGGFDQVLSGVGQVISLSRLFGHVSLAKWFWPFVDVMCEFCVLIVFAQVFSTSGFGQNEFSSMVFAKLALAKWFWPGVVGLVGLARVFWQVGSGCVTLARWFGARSCWPCFLPDIFVYNVFCHMCSLHSVVVNWLLREVVSIRWY